MSYNRGGYIGRAPSDSSVTVSKQYFEPTGAASTFTFSAGYDPGYLEVYRNGVKLVNPLDYAATDGSTITLTTPVGIGTTVEAIATKAYNVSNVEASTLNTTCNGTNLILSGDLTVEGDIEYDEVIGRNVNLSGVTTTVGLNVTGIGTFVDINVSGAVTANAFVGDGSALTGIGVTQYTDTGSLVVAGVSTLTGNVLVGASATVGFGSTVFFKDGNKLYFGDGEDLSIYHDGSHSYIDDTGTGGLYIDASGLTLRNANDENYAIFTSDGSTDLYFNNSKKFETTNDGTVTTGICTATDFSGASGGAADFPNGLTGTTGTFSGAVSGSTGTFSGAVNVDATTDSTSTSTGALIVDGGLAVAKNVYIGAGLSVAGTLTYEDVTSVDSVGMVTAKSGVNVSGGELNVGLGFSVGNVGVVTAQNVTISAGTIDLKNSGSVSNIKFYCESSNAHYTALQSAAHSEYGGNVTLTLPTTTDTLIGKTTTDTLTNKTLTSPTLTTPVFSGAATGELKVGSGITIAATSGVGTFADSSSGTTNALHFGSGGDLKIFHNATNSEIKNATGTLYLESDGTWITDKEGSDKMAKFLHDSSVELYYDNSKKWETTNDGTVTTGIGTFTGNIVCVNAEPTGNINMPDSGSGSAGRLRFGAGADFQLYHDGSDNYISGDVNGMDLFVRSRKDVTIQCGDNSSGYHNVLYADNNGHNRLYHPAADAERLRTTTEGIEVTGFTSTTAGMGVTGGLFEGSFIKAGKLSDNQTLGISTANVFYFTTQETTTATPNIVWNDTHSLSNKMAVGDVASVTVITTAAAGGYAANWTIDGNAVTEEWVGGSAPSAGGSDGLDIYSLTIIKTGTGTGDSGFKVIANVSNAT